MRRHRIVLLVFLITIFSYVCIQAGCGGGGSNTATRHVPTVSQEPAPKADYELPRELTVEEAVALVDAHICPDGVDEAVWAGLTAELKRVLAVRAPDKITSTPPTSAGSVTSLSYDGMAGALGWMFYSQGDYDQNGEVNINDLTPLGTHFRETGPFLETSALSAIDGQRDNELNISDVSPIGQYFNCTLASYKVFTSADYSDYPAAGGIAANGAGTVEVAEVLISEATGNTATDRLQFSHVIASPVPNNFYWVRPVCRNGQLGVPSNAVQLPAYSNLKFNQTDLTLNGVKIVDSPYGNVEVSYVGKEDPQYFNLVIDGRWVIKNIPVLAHNGVGEDHTVLMEFNLGNTAGTEVASLEMAASMTDDVITVQPSVTSTVTVNSQIVNITDGRGPATEGAAKRASEGDGPSDEEGGKVVDSATHGSSFPNQECGDGQCVATGVSNSLEFLADANDIPIGDNADPPGSRPIDPATVDGKIGAVARAEGGDWAAAKAKWMREAGYPIHTYGIPAKDDQDHEATAAECEAAMEALKSGKDVEMNGEDHTAALVGMAKLDNGKYVMYVAHDIDQGALPDHAGGTCVQKVVYDPNSVLPEARDGYGFADGMINGFVVEEYPLLVDSWPHINFEQLNFAMDNPPVEDSGTGRCHTEFPVLTEQSYFNLSHDGQWVIRNMPIPMFKASSGSFTVSIPFNLGVPDGTEVESNYYDTSITTELLTEAPSREYLDTVGEAEYHITSGETGETIEYIEPVPFEMWWFPGIVVNGAFHDLDDVVNQDCDDGECAPAAVSNSLKTLRNQHPEEMYGLTDDPESETDHTDIETMKPATGFHETPKPGSPGSDDYTDADAWWNRKDSWMDARDNYHISTRLITDPDDFGDVIDAIRDGKDVELRVPGHVVMVVGAVQLINGDYVLWVAHDTDQGKDGGTVIEPVYYDAVNACFYGSLWAIYEFFGSGDGCFVVESVYDSVFTQEDYVLDEVPYAKTPWGSEDITTSATTLEYYNLSVNGEWVVRNLPVPPFNQSGGEHTIRARFGYGTELGTAIPSVTYGSSLGSEPLTAAPLEEAEANIEVGLVQLNSGEPENSILYEPPPEEPIIWDPAPITGIAYHPAEKVVNQDCQKGECAPTAVSNSMKVLKDSNPVGMSGLTDDPGSNNDDTDINTMKSATNFTDGPPPGSPGIVLGGDFNDPDAWWNQKDSWMINNDRYPIITRTVTNPANLNEVMDALNNGEDVELRVPGHVVMVVGAVQYLNGDYTFYVAHDSNQGNAGGTVIEPVYYNAMNGTLSGGPWADGYKVGSGESLFIVESVEILSIPSTFDYLGPYTLGTNTLPDPGWVMSTTPMVFTVTHPILGDITTDPDTEITVSPFGAGTFAGGTLNLDATYHGPFSVVSTTKGYPTDPGYLYFRCYPLRDDSVYAWPDTDEAVQGETVTITVHCNASASPFTFLGGVRVTVPFGNTYTPGTFNIGAPGGAVHDSDGIWSLINAPGGYDTSTDVSILPVPLGLLTGYDFFIWPVGSAVELTGATGELFNFGLTVENDVTIGIERLEGATPRTFYFGQDFLEKYWSSDNNEYAPAIDVSPPV